MVGSEIKIVRCFSEDISWLARVDLSVITEFGINLEKQTSFIVIYNNAILKPLIITKS